MTFDGSPQGKSAWLTKPYLVPPDGEEIGFKGHGIYSHKAAYDGLKNILSHGMQAHIHCNGDAAIDEGLNLMDTLKKKVFLLQICVVYLSIARFVVPIRFQDLSRSELCQVGFQPIVTFGEIGI